MDRFPQYPPHDDTGAEIPETVEFLAWIGILTTAWVLALLAVGYWIAGAAPSAGSYIHGVLVGILVGMTLILTAATRKQKRRVNAGTTTPTEPRQ
jgi:hypothetical protein